VADTNYTCRKENIAAYIDGDLEPSLRSTLELHFKDCVGCAAELQAQQLFMCELDFALASPSDLPVPVNFARVVAVNAASDMSGARNASEHKRALRFCIVLGLAAFALLGFASSKALVLNAQAVGGKVFGIVSFIAQVVFNALSGLAVVLRVVSRGLIADSRLTGFAAFLLIALAVGVLSLLISRYHRTRLID
jgi:anti-sigma factor RsiW